MRLLVPVVTALEGRHLLGIERVGAAAADPMPVLALLDALAAVGERGGLAAPGWTGDTRFAQRLRRVELGAVEIDLDLIGIDPRFMQCLASVLAAADALEDWGEVRLVPVGGGELQLLPDPEQEGDDILYPEEREDLAFTLKAETIVSRMRTLVAVFPERQRAEDVAHLGAFLQPWGEALEAGAFVLPLLEPQERVNVWAGVQLFEPDSLEIVVDRFDSSEEAWGVLLNMLDRYARTVAPILSVEQY